MNAYNQPYNQATPLKQLEAERQPAIETAFQHLEKSVQELKEQWKRCATKLAPITSPWPVGPEKQVVADSPVPMVARIETINRNIQELVTSISEHTNQIEL